MYICQACCLAFPAWVAGRASVHSCSRDTMPWGPECLVLLSSYTASLQNYSSAPLVSTKSADPNSLPLSLSQAPFWFAERSQMYQVSLESRKWAFRNLWPTRAGCSWLSLVLRHDSGAFSRCLPSQEELLYCHSLTLHLLQQITRSTRLPPKPTFWSQCPTFRPPAVLLTSTDYEAYLLQGHRHNSFLGNNMHKCFPWLVVVYQRASYNNGFCHSIINPFWTLNASRNGMG